LPWLVAVALFMQSLDTTILNTAVPNIARALQVAPLSMKAVLASYTLSLAVFIPVSGWMANRFGTRRVFAGAIGLFALGSLLCGLSRNIHLLVACRILQGCGGAMMVPVGRLTLVRALPKSQLVRAMSFVAVPALIGPMLGPIAGTLLSYVLEVFGEHRLSAAAILGLLLLSVLLLAGYRLNAARTAHPLLELGLFGIRTFRAAVAGSFFTRISIGGIPFLFPLLYQVGLGYSAVQSGLLMMPQAFAAMSLKMTMPGILARFGYRTVLVFNTAMLGVLIMLFATIGVATPVWLIVVLTFAYGFFQSLQFTSMNTLVYADVSPEAAGGASTIASTAQQLSMSFGVATASLVAALFLPDRFHTDAAQMIHGVHKAFLVLGIGTIASTAVFGGLQPTDGSAVSQHRVGEHRAALSADDS
jgi:MFS family permease